MSIALNSNNPRPWLWPLLLMAVVTLPILWLMPVLWAKGENLAVLVAFVALPGIALVGILASWMFRFPQILAYERSSKALTIQTHYGPEKLERSKVLSARAVDYALRFSIKSKGHFPGYYVGSYTLPEVGLVTAYVAQSKGTGVLLELRDGQKVLLSPQNPDDLLRFFK